MLHFPYEGVLNQAARTNLARFRETSAARELEEDTRAWRLVAWSWTSEPIAHFTVRDEHDERVYAVEPDGIWDVVSTDVVSVPRAPIDVRDREDPDAATATGRVAVWLHEALHGGMPKARGVC